MRHETVKLHEYKWMWPSFSWLLVWFVPAVKCNMCNTFQESETYIADNMSTKWDTCLTRSTVPVGRSPGILTLLPCQALAIHGLVWDCGALAVLEIKTDGIEISACWTERTTNLECDNIEKWKEPWKESTFVLLCFWYNVI